MPPILGGLPGFNSPRLCDEDAMEYSVTWYDMQEKPLTAYWLGECKFAYLFPLGKRGYVGG